MRIEKVNENKRCLLMCVGDDPYICEYTLPKPVKNDLGLVITLMHVSMDKPRRTRSFECFKKGKNSFEWVEINF